MNLKKTTSFSKAMNPSTQERTDMSTHDDPLPAGEVFRIKRECDALGLDIVAFAWRIHEENASLRGAIDAANFGDST
jgi:hypothetical protein